MLGVFCPMLLSAHRWRPEHEAADDSHAGSGSDSSRANALAGSIQRLVARCNRVLHLALHCSSRLRRFLLVSWMAGYLWVACKAIEG